MKKKIWLYLLLSALGAVSVYLGVFVIIAENLKMLSGLCIGLGAAVFCLGTGNAVGALVMSKTRTAEITRRKNIEVNDERNIRIKEKVGAKINQIMIYVLSAVVLAFGFMHVNIAAILIIASLFILELILAIFLTDHYSKTI
jgi:uncharacterized membrane protein